MAELRSPTEFHDTIVILDYGSQTTQLIARRIREVQIYCELFPWDTPAERVMALRPRGFILSGGPASVYEPGAPTLPAYVLESRRPILGTLPTGCNSWPTRWGDGSPLRLSGSTAPPE